MDQTHPIFKELVNEDIPLTNIYLDPNNPRFASMDWEYVADDKIRNEKIQKVLMEKLQEEYSIDLKMRMTMKSILTYRV